MRLCWAGEVRMVTILKRIYKNYKEKIVFVFAFNIYIYIYLCRLKKKVTNSVLSMG